MARTRQPYAELAVESLDDLASAFKVIRFSVPEPRVWDLYVNSLDRRDGCGLSIGRYTKNLQHDADTLAHAEPTLLFVLLRAIDVYGDPAKWSQEKSMLFTALSFVNTTKYPPSLLFLLMTLGPAILALAWFEKKPDRESRVGTSSLLVKLRNAFVTFGRVPLFFYILQWYVAHLIGIFAGLIAGQSVAHHFLNPEDKFSGPLLVDVGFRLWVVYVCWAIGVVLLYPLCKWFAAVKARRRDWWLSYL